MLQDNGGGISSQRVLLLVWCAVLIVVWCVVAIKTKTIPDIPAGVLTLSGIIIGGKVLQRFGEQPEPPPAPAADPIHTTTL